MTAQPAQQFYEANIAPVMKLYLDSMETWTKNYGAIAGTVQRNGQDFSAAPSKDSTIAFTNWQKSGEEAFKHFIELQIELCRFFAGRWEHYLKLTDQIAHCQTPAEAGQVQASFLSEFASDYMQESNKLTRPMGELMSQWTGMRHA